MPSALDEVRSGSFAYVMEQCRCKKRQGHIRLMLPIPVLANLYRFLADIPCMYPCIPLLVPLRTLFTFFQFGKLGDSLYLVPIVGECPAVYDIFNKHFKNDFLDSMANIRIWILKNKFDTTIYIQLPLTI